MSEQPTCTNEKRNAAGETVLCGNPRNAGASLCGDCHARQRYTTGARPVNSPANPHLDELRTRSNRT